VTKDENPSHKKSSQIGSTKEMETSVQHGGKLNRILERRFDGTRRSAEEIILEMMQG
jgi:hypothetical protein